MRSSFPNDFFVRFGAGSALLAPLKKLRHWSAIAWTLIVVSTLGWAVLLWVLRGA